MWIPHFLQNISLSVETHQCTFLSERILQISSKAGIQGFRKSPIPAVLSGIEKQLHEGTPPVRLPALGKRNNKENDYRGTGMEKTLHVNIVKIGMGPSYRSMQAILITMET